MCIHIYWHILTGNNYFSNRGKLPSGNLSPFFYVWPSNKPVKEHQFTKSAKKKKLKQRRQLSGTGSAVLKLLKQHQAIALKMVFLFGCRINTIVLKFQVRIHEIHRGHIKKWTGNLQRESSLSGALTSLFSKLQYDKSASGHHLGILSESWLKARENSKAFCKSVQQKSGRSPLRDHLSQEQQSILLITPQGSRFLI